MINVTLIFINKRDTFMRLDHERKQQPPEGNVDVQLKLQTRLCLKKDLTLITILAAHFD